MRSLTSIVLLLLTASCTKAQGYGLDEVISKMTSAPGVHVSLFAGEPEIRQPILVKHGPRGRLWTIQYLQYPKPAGLTPVEVDRWSRTVYDRVPKPPPRGPRGADKITIMEDTNGDGKADSFVDFIVGLNLCTSIEFGYGGVFVLQPPYLLHYADSNQDDIPDGDPRVLVRGFGMEDAQSMANHLTWGPDGWLYGVNGSTVTCRIRGLEFQQGVWRYHVASDRFELFSEGGGNTFGLTFDAVGRLLQSTNGAPMLHVLQGAYYYKSFSKHGPLHNLYTYGHLPFVKRDVMTGGPPTGGTIYYGKELPEEYQGRFVAGDFLGHNAFSWSLQPRGSTLEASFEGYLLKSNDTWFGPTDMCIAPDGSMYLSDFHDQRTAHPDPEANWDRSNGRIFRIFGDTDVTSPAVDVRKQSSPQLTKQTFQQNPWLNTRSRMELAGRNHLSEHSLFAPLSELPDKPSTALTTLWNYAAADLITAPILLSALSHSSEHVRTWGVRLAGDQPTLPTILARNLTTMAATDKSPRVVCQLAATARRHPSPQATQLLLAITRREDVWQDDCIPLMTWWAMEPQLESQLPRIHDYYCQSSAWEGAFSRDIGLKIIRRLAASGSTKELNAIAAIVKALPDSNRATAMNSLNLGLTERGGRLRGIGQGTLFTDFAEQSQDPPAPTPDLKKTPVQPSSPLLENYLLAQLSKPVVPIIFLKTAINLNVQQATSILETAYRLKNKARWNHDEIIKLALIHLPKLSLSIAREILVDPLSTELHEPALQCIERSGSVLSAPFLLEIYASMPDKHKTAIRRCMLGEKNAALVLLNAVDQKTIPKTDFRLSELRITSHHDSPHLEQLIEKHFGRITAGTREEILAEMRRLNNDLRHAHGNPTDGKTLFLKHCGKCHKLYDVGVNVGPDLTGENRQDLATLLSNIVDPSAVIKSDYLAVVISTTSGQIISGLIKSRNASRIEVVDNQLKIHSIPLQAIDELKVSETSLMPAELLKSLTPTEVRDLFSFLQITKPID